jgi:threonine dehydratase
MLQSKSLLQAQQRIKTFIHLTPILESHLLNEWLGTRILFKAEGLQKTGSFKFRGAINALLAAIERGKKPARVAVFSSGNHAQGCAWACKLLNIPLQVFMPSSTSSLKIQATRSYGAQVILTQTRQESENLCDQAEREGALKLSPFDHDDVILGQATLAYEALSTYPSVKALFATCGGGGCLSGSWLARDLLEHSCQIYGCEPEVADDAKRSVQQGSIFRFPTPPESIADGARTPSVCERTFYFLKKINGFYTASEQEIIYWCQWLSHLLKIPVEPTSAVAMVGAYKHLKLYPNCDTLMILLTGGNLSAETQSKIWQENYLCYLPGSH